VAILVNFDDSPQNIRSAGASHLGSALGTHEVRYGGTSASGRLYGVKVLGDATQWVACPGPGALRLREKRPTHDRSRQFTDTSTNLPARTRGLG